MTNDIEQRLDALANTVASLPKYGVAETPRVLDSIREDIGDIQDELTAIKMQPKSPTGLSTAQVDAKLHQLAQKLMQATSGAFKERLQTTEKRIDEVAEDARRHTDGSLADIRANANKALSGIEASAFAGVAAIRALLRNEV